MYKAKVDQGKVGDLVRAGYDVASVRQTPRGLEVDLVLSAAERSRLAAEGVKTEAIRNKAGLTVRQQAALQSAYGFEVWRSWDEPGGIRDELYALARRYSGIVELQVIGRSLEGREIIALKVTEGARGRRDGSKPAVLYMSNVHAREWISVEVNRRLLHHFLSGYPRDAEIRNLLRTRELWFVISANPDGYQHTFDVERLWRKNLRDNDDDGEITNADGVDLNRNYDINWGYDNEGSSPNFSSQTYRGAAPASEPETQAAQALIDRMKFKFLVTYHSYGNLLLYPFGWQIQTPTADDPLYVAYSGTDANPAIAGYDPGVAADLYITNGTTDDYSYSKTGALSWTPELAEGCPGCGFVFPDDEAKIQEEFERNLPFALDLARSAPDPTSPRSHLGTTAEPFYLDISALDPEKSNNPMSDFRFDVSYGDPQPVRVLAKRSLGAVTVKYRVNGGAVQSAPTSEWNGGERYGDGGDFYYRVVQGLVTGTEPGDTVEVWFEGGGSTSESFTYGAAVESDNRVLVMAAEDYSGISTFPLYPAGARPAYLSYYLDALAANGIGADVYDVDGRGRKAPSALGVLSHYDAVVWYTGNDVITREPGMVPGTASRLANDEMLAVRAYMNEGGNLLYTGKMGPLQYFDGYSFDIHANQPCPNPNCQPLSNDFFQYYLGGYLWNIDAGTKAEGGVYDVHGVDDPFTSLTWGFGDPSAGNHDFDSLSSGSFLATSGFLPPDDFPQFASSASAKYDRPGGPFEPHTGEHYVYSQIGDVSYKRLTRTIAVPSGGGDLSFWISRDTEPHWDFVFVEAHTVGEDDWTTLPDLNGHTSSDTGDSCPAGWFELHPWLERYQGPDCSGANPATGGAWHAAEGSSHGWEQWRVDLSPYAGKQVEISIAYASDWAVQGLGAFVDDIATSTGEGATSFEDGMGGWEVSGPPPGSAPNPNNWIRTTAAGFPEGATITTDDSVMLGFGVEGIAGADARAALVGRVMEHLLD